MEGELEMGVWVWSSELREVMGGTWCGCGWTLWMERTSGVRGALGTEFFYCVIEYEM